MSRSRLVAAIIVSVLLVGVAGCEWLVGTHAASFAAGYFMGAASGGTQVTCYHNGEPIDCADVPAEMQ
jgi:hypothetical protein